jgi:cohesin complex subunit SCC1
MFFEMLILGTRDCIKLDQPKAYGDISVQAKPKLWEVCEGLDKLNVAGEDDADRERERERERTPTASIRSRRSSRSVSVQA